MEGDEEEDDDEDDTSFEASFRRSGSEAPSQVSMEYIYKHGKHVVIYHVVVSWGIKLDSFVVLHNPLLVTTSVTL